MIIEMYWQESFNGGRCAYNAWCSWLARSQIEKYFHFFLLSLFSLRLLSLISLQYNLLVSCFFLTRGQEGNSDPVIGRAIKKILVHWFSFLLFNFFVCWFYFFVSFFLDSSFSFSRTRRESKSRYWASNTEHFCWISIFSFPNDFCRTTAYYLIPFRPQNFGRGCAGWIGERAAYPAGVYTHP